MHWVLRSLPVAMLLAGLTVATGSPKKLTIVVDFQGPYSARSVSEMQHELEDIMKESGLTFTWRGKKEAASAAYDNLVVVRFKGKCILEPVGYLYDERGPLAFTHTTDGELLPFSEVACDQVTATMRSAMFGGDYARADQLLGRALGRVVAHELIHILTRSNQHGHAGVAKPALSGQQLISEKLELESGDIYRLNSDNRR